MLTINDCVSERLNPEHNVQGFVCKDESISKFLREKARDFTEEMLCVTYVFTPIDNPSQVAAYYTASNDALILYNLPRSRKEKIIGIIPHIKRYVDSFPAIKIGMLGKNRSLLGPGAGRMLLDHIKGWAIVENTAAACRFIVVDAHNEPAVIRLYEDNEFEFLFPNEQQEREYFKVKQDKPLKTRYMFYDLLPLANKLREMGQIGQ